MTLQNTASLDLTREKVIAKTSKPQGYNVFLQNTQRASRRGQFSNRQTCQTETVKNDLSEQLNLWPKSNNEPLKPRRSWNFVQSLHRQKAKSTNCRNVIFVNLPKQQNNQSKKAGINRRVERRSVWSDFFETTKHTKQNHVQHHRTTAARRQRLHAAAELPAPVPHLALPATARLRRAGCRCVGPNKNK
jgi:hypothetical protein